MTAVCCSGRCLGCCRCCRSRRARARRVQLLAVLAVLLVLLGAALARGCTQASSWSGWQLLGAALAAPLLHPLGRRAVLALAVPLQAAALLLWAFSPEQDAEGTRQVWVQLAVSGCAGAALGMATPAAVLYLAEVWRPARRGAACCVPALAAVAGRLLAAAGGVLVLLSPAPAPAPLLAVLAAGLAPGGLALLLLPLAPASPYWLALRGREGALIHTLTRLRGLRDGRGARDEADDVLDGVRRQCAGGNLRGTVLAVLLVGTVPLAGARILDEYLVGLVTPLVSGLVAAPEDVPRLLRVLFGAELVLAVAGVAVLVDRCGRRPLLLAACALLAAGHATLGYFYYFLGGEVLAVKPLAASICVAGVVVAVMGVAALGALSWVLLAEVLPVRAKALVPVLALLLDTILQAATEALLVAVPWWGADGGKLWPAAWFWAHALWSLLLALIVSVLLPETAGFSLPQVHEILKGPNRESQQTRL